MEQKHQILAKRNYSLYYCLLMKVPMVHTYRFAQHVPG